MRQGFVSVQAARKSLLEKVVVVYMRLAEHQITNSSQSMSQASSVYTLQGQKLLRYMDEGRTNEKSLESNSQEVQIKTRAKNVNKQHFPDLI